MIALLTLILVVLLVCVASVLIFGGQTEWQDDEPDEHDALNGPW